MRTLLWPIIKKEASTLMWMLAYDDTGLLGFLKKTLFAITPNHLT